MERSLYAAIQDVRQQKRVAFYLLYGNQDAYAGEWLVTEIQRSFETLEGAAPMRALFSYSAADWDNCVATAYQGDLFAPRQIVLCKEFDLVTSSVKAKSADAAVADSFAELFKHPPELPMVFFTAADKLDERKKLTKQFLADNRSIVVALNRMTRDTWKQIISEWSLPDLALTPWQQEQLEARSAGSLSVLRQELDKLKLYATGRGRIKDQELLALCADRAAGDMFAVVRAVVAKEPGKAYELYRKLGAHDTFFALLALLSRQYRLIASIHAGPTVPDATIAKVLGVHPYGVKVAREQARHVSLQEAERMLTWMNTLEVQVKTGQLQEKTAAEWFFIKAFA